ncbi:MAG: hypothetical protein ACI8QG_001444, partial [Flavobacteriales bacterium]
TVIGFVLVLTGNIVVLTPIHKIKMLMGFDKPLGQGAN